MFQYNLQYLYITHSCVCFYLSIVVYTSQCDVPSKGTGGNDWQGGYSGNRGHNVPYTDIMYQSGQTKD